MRSAIKPIHRVHSLRHWWWAAAIILAIGTITAIALSSGEHKTQSGSDLSTNSSPADVVPGSNKAILILADGNLIRLDSAGNGAIAQQGNASVIKLSNGEIRYDLKGLTQHEVMMNTISTTQRRTV